MISISGYMGSTITPEEFTIACNRLKGDESCLSMYAIQVLGKFVEECDQYWRKFDHRCFACLVRNDSSEILLKIFDFQSQFTPESIHVILDVKLHSPFHIHINLRNVLSMIGHKYALGLNFLSPEEDVQNFVCIVNNIIPERRSRSHYKHHVDNAVKLMKDTDIKNWLQINGTALPFFVRKFKLLKTAKVKTSWTLHTFRQTVVQSDLKKFFRQENHIEKDRESSGVSSNNSSIASEDFAPKRNLTLKDQIQNHYGLNGRRISKLYEEIADPKTIYQLQENRLGRCSTAPYDFRIHGRYM